MSSSRPSIPLLTDPLAVYGALLPKAKVASVPRAHVRLVDTILFSGGRVWKWLYTVPSSLDVAERVHTDTEAIHGAFLQSALGSGGNVRRLMMLVRRTSGALELLDVEQSVEFFRRLEEELPTLVALQKYVHGRGGDRSVYRVTYRAPPAAVAGGKGAAAALTTAPSAPPPIEVTRFFEHLRPMGDSGAAAAEIAPMRSSQPGVNNALEELVRRVVPYVEHNLRRRIACAELDCVFDEREQPYLLWPTEVRLVDSSSATSGSRQRAGVELPLPAAGAALPRGRGAPGGGSATRTAVGSSSEGVSGGSRRLELTAALDTHPALASSSSAVHRDGMFATLDVEQRDAEEEGLAAEFVALLAAPSVGSGRRGRVLLVETDPHTACVVAGALASAEYAVTAAADGPAALSLTRKSVFDCLLIGKLLPSLSGIEVTRMIRQREATLTHATRGVTLGASTPSPPPYLPIVVLTDDTGQEDLRRYMECGMDGCVAKPLDVPTLLATMAAAVPVSHAALGSPIAPPSEIHAASTVAAAHSAPAEGSTLPAATGALPREGGGAASTLRWQPAPLSSDSLVGAYAEGTMACSTAEAGVVLRGGGAQAALSGTSRPGARPAGAPSAGGGGAAQRSPYRQLPPPRARRASASSVRTAGGGAAAASSGGPPARAAAAIAGGRPGVFVLPAGAAIPGISPPVGAGVGASAPSIAGGGGGFPTLPVGESLEGVSLGVFQLDSATSMPYCALGVSRPGVPLFHLVIVGDLFDTYESYQILLRKSLTRLPGLRVLLFNYPGQGHTEWRRDVVLNNEYLAGCLQALLTYVGASGTREFHLDGGDAPFYVVGVGNGGCVAAYWATAYAASHASLRGALLVNAFAFVDAHLAAVLRDCVNVFACTPPSRPDLPAYFFARYLFSPAYLARVGAPLAMNLATAVFNPITLEGRAALCRGALSHVDVREPLADLPLPLILVASSLDGLVKPSHVAAIVEARGGETRSIKRALLERARACVVWMRAGHDVFQEARAPMVNLLEQLATGFHETNDIIFLPLAPEDEARMGGGAPEATPGSSAATAIAASRSRTTALLSTTAGAGARADGRGGAGARGSGAAALDDRPLEDRFLDSIVRTMRTGGTVVQTTPFAPGAGSGGYKGHGAPPAQVSDVPDALHHVPEVPAEVRRAERAVVGVGAAAASGAARRRPPQAGARTSGALAPPAGATSGTSSELPEVHEYMSWRVRRNRKRLARIEACAAVVQRCWRAYLSRSLVVRMRSQRACIEMQRWWRGIAARRLVARLRRELWAATAVQRCWRGFWGRRLTERLREERGASTLIQKNWKGARTRAFVRRVRALRAYAVIKIQALARRWRAQRLVWRMRDQRAAATNIQRLFRGHRGRGRAARERDRFLFSRSQAQGIEFARQMLMEHKLHATRLQSEVALLSREKRAAEERVEALLAEVGSFEAGTLALERQMLELSRAEGEAAGMLEEGARGELREAKIRLDREFGALLARIADRREQLLGAEAALGALERTRGAKREELRDLERRLVLLLEQQQEELRAIRTRQDARQESMVEDAITAVRSALAENDPGVAGARRYAAARGGAAGGALTDGGGGAAGALLALAERGGAGRASGGAEGSAAAATTSLAAAGGHSLGGPSPQQRAEAAALMASTETMMKFGFMSMSLTYFSSLNMIKAMRQLGTANTALAGSPMLTMLGAMGAVAASGGSASAAAAAIGGARAPAGGEVSLWTVADVGAWLDSVCLGQYKDAFADAAVDGAFMVELTEEDLRATLGIEHALHRKKLMTTIARLRAAEEAARMAAVRSALGDSAAQGAGGDGGGGPPQPAPSWEPGEPIGRRASVLGAGLSGAALRAAGALQGARASMAAADPPGLSAAGSRRLAGAEADAAARAAARDAGLLRLGELASWVRHNKGRLVSDALASVPDGRFDRTYLREQLVLDVGTVYADVLSGPTFHVNQADEAGNTLLTVAAQNGRIKIAQLLVRKGGNANHQNAQGNSPLHFAMAYNFHDLAAWLVDPDKGGADDSLLNAAGLAAYDGLGDGK